MFLRTHEGRYEVQGKKNAFYIQLKPYFSPDLSSDMFKQPTPKYGLYKFAHALNKNVNWYEKNKHKMFQKI